MYGEPKEARIWRWLTRVGVPHGKRGEPTFKFCEKGLWIEFVEVRDKSEGRRMRAWMEQGRSKLGWSDRDGWGGKVACWFFTRRVVALVGLLV